ncbi:MAG TPA: lantibiotic dehydratase C-terminal domain-containing protein [Longimicrobiaceae bacterium]|nr:lantibiotic dehydratase C-terminal domain-containing protein [Longimicrobiaceae bacterium]
MSEWRSFHLYYRDVDRLILECVHPVLVRSGERVERGFWERHYAGGPHLRVALRGAAPDLDTACSDLVDSARRFFAEHPSSDLDSYSETRAAELLRKEGRQPDEEDLRYRNNTLLERPYAPPRHVYVSDEAAAVAEEFRHAMMPLAVELVGGARPRREQMLRIFFLHALLFGDGDPARGAVSFKSHWEGFAATARYPEIVERIVDSYRSNRAGILQLMEEVRESFERGELERDPVLGAWRDLVTRFRTRARQVLQQGAQLTPQPSTPAEAARLREEVLGNVRRESDFVRTLWADERFIASIQHEPAFLVPRVLTNLLYLVVAAAGLSPLDKMALCHHSFRAVEEHYGCNLNQILEQNIAAVVRSHSHRWGSSEAMAPRLG